MFVCSARQKGHLAKEAPSGFEQIVCQHLPAVLLHLDCRLTDISLVRLPRLICFILLLLCDLTRVV